MKRSAPLLLCLLFAGCAMLDDYDSFYEQGMYDGGFYEQPMAMQPTYMPTTPPIATASCNGCGSARQPIQQAGYQTNEPPMLKQTPEPPK